ncbi:ATP-dependent 6-phosphofructokinase 1 [Halomicronema hongdechloris C2206]|uniref:ATP-dependent 6-phosphofructokinase n=1 Tax=Halomicronema hongdechloris C2206 TaxID=1641165 RepID=A0A1Z3HK44_9CYAN|nr:ATP-dependent 6-phosphofructokinase [Halomicronema hongdechloris]ASC70655.1 ATP-dependent 6-phosphofructokinase 1 [Halomicronema hongdechloris C2206]
MTEITRIGILTSGGDCAGLNAAIRAVTHRAIGTYGWEVIGICRATQGLMSRPPEYMSFTIQDTYPLLTMGGTVLGTTNKGNPFAFPMADGRLCDRTDDIIAGYHQLELDALIGIGGDGSLAILRQLAQRGNLKLVAIPKTIDNDLGSTEIAVGFDTAVNIATEALDRLHFTAASHSRVMILEVMGRDAGHIALSAGIAGGADIILIPEIPYSLDVVCEQLRQLQAQGRNFAIVIVAEAVCTETGEKVTQTNRLGQCRLGGIGQYLADAIATGIGAETRVTVLGHVQRGGIPSPRDRLIATAFGVAAVDLIAQGRFDHMVSWQHRQVVSVPIADAIAQYRAVDPTDTLVKTAQAMGICLGNPPTPCLTHGVSPVSVTAKHDRVNI